MYHRKCRHITDTGNIVIDDMELESGESDLDSYVATVRTCWSVKAYSGEPLASAVTKTSRKATLSTREMERMSYPGPLPLLYEVEDTNISFLGLGWNKTSKWIVSMKHQDRWWYIVCAFMTV